MAEKRKRQTKERSDSTKKPRGFTVGPANLPDGVYKRKNQKIKQSLIERAQIKKQYAKVRERSEKIAADESLPVPASSHLDRQEPQKDDKDDGAANTDNGSQTGATDAEVSTASTTPHPDRQRQIADESNADPPSTDNDPVTSSLRRRGPKRPKISPFQREEHQAQRRKEEAESRRLLREEAEREKQKKYEERESWRRAMAKARPSGGGQRKLGRESQVLLEKVRRMVG